MTVEVHNHCQLLVVHQLTVMFSKNVLNLPKTKKFGCVGRGDLTSLFFSKVVKY